LSAGRSRHENRGLQDLYPVVDICRCWFKHQRATLASIPALGLLFLLGFWSLLFSRNCQILDALYRLVDGIFDRFRHGCCWLSSQKRNASINISVALSQAPRQVVWLSTWYDCGGRTTISGTRVDQDDSIAQKFLITSDYNFRQLRARDTSHYRLGRCIWWGCGGWSGRCHVSPIGRFFPCKEFFANFSCDQVKLRITDCKTHIAYTMSFRGTPRGGRGGSFGGGRGGFTPRGGV
jgi:hypothetical protein